MADVDYLIVGGGASGGGNGGNNSGGGGGAGEVAQGTASVSVGVYPIVVGDGGAAVSTGNGNAGGDSSAFGVTALGGGPGSQGGAGVDGGSGGGGGGGGGSLDPTAGDTLASHGGWAEITDYTGDRKALTLGSVSGQSVNNSGSPASFAIDDTATVAGGFICTVDTGTSGVLYGAADFGSPRAVENGDTLNVTCTLTAAAA